jgi:hypothetical protein
MSQILLGPIAAKKLEKRFVLRPNKIRIFYWPQAKNFLDPAGHLITIL